MGMSVLFRSTMAVMLVCFVTGCASMGGDSNAPSAAARIDRDVEDALRKLYASTPEAEKMSASSKGILVFPNIMKGGLIVGGHYGEGALLKNGKTEGYYNTISASYGLQAGIQKFGYALFFADDESLSYLNRMGGWEVGVGPSVVLVDEGVARSLSTTTLKKGIYAFFFDQRGLMASMGIQGTKINRIDPR